MLSIMTTLKPCRGDNTEDHQWNALSSWLNIIPEGMEIIVLGVEEGVSEFIDSLNTHRPETPVKLISEVERSKYGAPLLNDAFRKGFEVAENDVLAYINGDIILMNDFRDALLKTVNHFEDFMVGLRVWDAVSFGRIDFSDEGWLSTYRRWALGEGALRDPNGVDVFVFSRSAFPNGYIEKPLRLGRVYFDNYLLYHGKKNTGVLIDWTPSVVAMHQRHDYGHVGDDPFSHPDGVRNSELAPAFERATMNDATHVLPPGWCQPGRISFGKKEKG